MGMDAIYWSLCGILFYWNLCCIVAEGDKDSFSLCAVKVNGYNMLLLRKCVNKGIDVLKGSSKVNYDITKRSF